MLQHNNITLRPMQDSDKTVLSNLINNKKISDNLRDIVPFPYTEQDGEFFINMTKNENPVVTFAIEYKGDFCGVIGLVPQKDVYRKSAEIGYWIGEPYWNKGIATIAVKLVTEYGLNVLGFNRIHTGVFEYNKASMKVLEKNGFEKEGIFRKSVFKNGQFRDEHRYSIIRQ